MSADIASVVALAELGYPDREREAPWHRSSSGRLMKN